MLICIRLKDHPGKYVGTRNTTWALACDETRKQAIRNGYSPDYYTRIESYGFISNHWFVSKQEANTWTRISDLKRTLSASAYGWEGAPRWAATTWSAYEVVHLDTGKVEPLDMFLLPYRKGFLTAP